MKKTEQIQFGRVKNGLPHCAHVSLTVEFPSESPGIVFNCSGAGFTSQGYLEEASENGYEDWKAGARVGVAFALAAAARSDCHVVINKIEGLTTDTNPSIVAYTSALAVWKAFGFNPPNEMVEKIESVVFGSWKRPHDEIPVFT